jgi:hypothetical protein
MKMFLSFLKSYSVTSAILLGLLLVAIFFSKLIVMGKQKINTFVNSESMTPIFVKKAQILLERAESKKENKLNMLILSTAAQTYLLNALQIEPGAAATNEEMTKLLNELRKKAQNIQSATYKSLSTVTKTSKAMISL